MTFRLFLLFLVVLFGAKYLGDRFGGGSTTEPWRERYPLHSSSARIDGETWIGIEIRDGVMGTRFSVEIHAPDDATGRVAVNMAWRRIHAMETMFSSWIPDSLTSRVNRGAAVAPVHADLPFHDLLEICRYVHKRSRGAFDPTVGPLLRVWRPLAKQKAVPSPDSVRKARALVGLDRIVVDAEARTVSFPVPGMALDFGGVAKGLAADEASLMAMEHGASACRVNAGGDMFARGRTFEVTIRDPDGGPGDTLSGISFEVHDAGVATSGNYERYTEVDGRRYSHILDPRTGRPVEDAIIQVTVIAPSGARADAFATAFTVLGVEEGLALANSITDVEALFLLRRDGQLVRLPSNGFPGITK